MEHKKRFNVVGATIRKVRVSENLTQEQLTAKCNIAGCDISRGTLAKIESQIRNINDTELFIISKVLKVKMEELFPTKW